MALRSNEWPKQKNRRPLLGATIEFVCAWDGDAHPEIRVAHAVKLAKIVRRARPGIVLAPTLAENQHPDHVRLGTLVRDAVRLARYGGLKELRGQPPHFIGQLFFYAITPEAEPAGGPPLLVDVSSAEVVAAWTASMESNGQPNVSD